MIKNILIIVGIVLLCIILFYLVCQTKLRTYIYALLLEAEKEFDAGQTKFEFVCKNAYEYIPAYLQAFISYGLFKMFVQDLYDKMRDLALDGKMNGEK